MGQFIILGSGYAIPEEGHDNTHIFIRQAEHGILVDCASNPIIQLRRAEIALDQVTDLVLTHFHPDHVAGFPLFLMDLWLLGRRKPLHVYGLQYTIERAEAMMKLYEWRKWPGFFPVSFYRLPETEMSLFISDPILKIYSSPVKHLIPTVGLRVEFVREEKVVAYSCDTEPCPQVVTLATKADLLIHEATGAGVGHSSPAQAGQIARQSEAQKLMLIHYSKAKAAESVKLAEGVYAGPVQLAEDLMKLDF